MPDGGGHRKLGRAVTKNRQGLGYTHIHTAIDAYSRLAYSEFAGTENTTNCVAFLGRAIDWFTNHGITVERILTDNGTATARFHGVKSFGLRSMLIIQRSKGLADRRDDRERRRVGRHGCRAACCLPSSASSSSVGA